MQSEVVGNDTPSDSLHLSELALVGEISLLVHDARDLPPLDEALDQLRQFTAAEAGDLFLAHPDGSEAFLVSHAGEDREAFGQLARFRRGEGLPGIVLQTAAAVWTRHLPDEVDFLRTRVVGRGYRSAACVPLLSDGVVEGCVVVAWKGAKRHLLHTVQALTLAARPLATGVRLLRTRLQTEARRSVQGEGEGEAVAERLRAGIPTGSVTLIPVHAQTGSGAAVPCPACADGSVQVLGGRAGWPDACVQAGCSARVRYCLGVDRETEGWTVATLAFREREPVPLTRHVPTALWLAKSDDTPSVGSVGIHGPSGDVRSRAHLEIRCLGRFEVLVDGHPVPHRRFGRSKAIELLALLASAARPVPVEELERSLWPGAGASLTRNRLHVTLSALRSAVENGPEAGTMHILRNGRFYSLNRRSSVEVDLWRFQDLLNTVTASSRGGGSPEAASRLREAVALGQGRPFDGAFAGDWVQGVEQRVRAQLQSALERLARIAVAERPAPGIRQVFKEGQ